MLPSLIIEVLHGEIKSNEKNHIMELFRSHKLDILVSTTVIEVRLDVQNANITIIYNSERIGLS